MHTLITQETFLVSSRLPGLVLLGRYKTDLFHALASSVPNCSPGAGNL